MNINKEKFLELYKLSLSDKEISEKLSVSRKSIQRYRKSLELTSNYSIINSNLNENIISLVKLGLTDKQISIKLNCSIAGVYKVRLKNNIDSNTIVGITSKNFKEIPLDLLYGVLLGDGWLTKSKIGNCKGGIFHKDLNLDYLKYKRTLLGEKNCLEIKFIDRKNKIYKIKNRIINSSNGYMFGIKSSEYLNMIHRKLYVNGKKRLSNKIIKNLSERSIALFFFDDGSKVYKSGKRGNYFTYKIAMYDYTDVCRNNLIRFLKNNFDIGSFQNHGTIQISAKDKLKFKSILSRYCVESMKYKL